MEGGAEAIQAFRAGINEFKKPYIEKLESYQKKTNDDDDALEDEDVQYMGRVHDVLEKLDALYLILEGAIRNGGKNTRPDEEAKSVCAYFDKNGSFSKLREDNTLKDEFLKYLKIDLKVFPFTLNTKLINSFVKNNIESHQRDNIDII
jgi:hypothetical protein